MNNKNKNKRKGGHERELERNKKLLSLASQKCGKINKYFKGMLHFRTHKFITFF